MDDMARYKASGCLRALQCACILRTYHTSKLSAHLGVSFGEMKLALLGGLHDQWVYLMNGACVSELAKCIDDAGPKEVAATQECYERALKAFNEFIDSTPAPALATIDKKRQIDDGGGLRMAALKHSDSNQAIVRTDSRESMDEATPIIKTRACKEGSTNILVDAVDEIYIGTKKQKTPGGRRLSLLRRQTTRKIDLLNAIPTQDERGEQMGILESAAFFVPRPILAAVYSESLEHIGELRQVTTMFLSLDSYSPILHRDPSSLQPFFLMAQGILFEAGGFLRQFLVDDKGCVFIAMWGMPSFTYANNCSRALSCGVSIGMGAKELDHKCSIGITTGNVFCGSVGAPERRDYAGIGNEVNLAARLMGKAKGRVLIDESTYTNLNHVTKQLLRPAEEMKLKGMDKPITPYEYASDTIPRVAALDENPGYSTILRKQVKAILSTQMDKITNSNPLAMHSNEPKNVYFTIILGMPGTGKSTAAEYFRHGLRKRNIPCLLIQARPGHEGVPYGLMRELFLELIGEENFITEAQQRQQITYLVEQAYPESEEVEKEKARLSIELVLGVEWSDIFQSRIPGDYSPQDPDSGRRGSTSAQENSNRKSPLKVTSPRSPKNSLHKNAVMNNSQSTHSSNSDNFTELGSNKQSQFGLLEDYNKTMSRAVGDLSFYKIICILLRNTRTAIVIEDAHFCDELSWNELHLLLTGSELDLVVLITMRSNTNVKANVGGSSDFMAPFQGDRTTTKRQSVLASQIDSNAIAGSTVGEGDMVSRYGLKFQTSASYLSILGHENSIVVEMTSLNESEVKEILMHTLKVDDISSDLVKLVLDVSSGNAFWCKAIANFIKERGVKELEKATEGDNHNRQNSLKQLILLRMEKLNVDQQLVLKHAAIIGKWLLLYYSLQILFVLITVFFRR